MFELTPFSRHNNNMAMSHFFPDLRNWEKDFFNDSFLTEFKTDIKDVGNAYLLEADLPGFKKEDIHIDLSGDYLTINAARNDKTEEKDKDGNYLRRERFYGAFKRSFDVSGVKTDDIKACYEDGVLKLNLPKKDSQERPGSRSINIL